MSPKQDNSPLIIAHRGASGYLPEHSLAAKALAYGMGADYLEQDLVVSRDGVLLVLHDLWLDDVSDVAERFPRRCREDGHYYCLDFDLDEIRTLAFHERLMPGSGVQKYPRRFPHTAGQFSVVTFAEEMAFVAAMNASCGRQVGIYPEIKAPEWHAEQGIDLASLVIDALESNGYLDGRQRVFLQCFDADTLVKARNRAGDRLPVIQLLGSRTRVDETLLDSIGKYADGIGPSLKLILERVEADGTFAHTGLVQQAQQRGLVVHPYTFRADELPAGCSDLETLLHICIAELGVDGLFTDFTDRAYRYRASL